jgi:Fur family transcriptional regulator, ferric uptake regulator
MVADILRTYATPLTLQQLHGLVRERLPDTAYSTVYRIVKRLQDERKVVRVDWRERGSRYEWADLPHHHHLVCTICRKSIDIDDRDLGFSEERIRARTGFLVDHHSIELEGICPACQQLAATRNARSRATPRERATDRARA